MSDNFFQCRIILFPCISLQVFPPRNESAGNFFLKSLIIPSKVRWSAPKIDQTFAQLTDSDLPIISKAFWNNRGQNSLGGRGGIFFSLPLPGDSVQTYGRTYGDVITKFSRMDSLPNFLSYGLPSRALRTRGSSATILLAKCPWLCYVSQRVK